MTIINEGDYRRLCNAHFDGNYVTDANIILVSNKSRCQACYDMYYKVYAERKDMQIPLDIKEKSKEVQAELRNLMAFARNVKKTVRDLTK